MDESSFPSPVYRLIRQINTYGGLHGRGYLHALSWFSRLLATAPLRWIEYFSTRKKLKDIVIDKPPIFILGYYRSGTTYLQRMFMEDSRLGYMSLFQTVFPDLILCFEKAMTPLLEWLSKLLRAENPFHNIPLSWYSAGEEDVGMTNLISSYSIQWGYLFPQKMNAHLNKYVLLDGLSEPEKQAWLKTYLYLIRKISCANHQKQLVLKNPPNMARIRYILSMFPDAKFVYIQRDPFDTYASNKRMVQMIFKKYALGKSVDVDPAPLILDSYVLMLEHYHRDKLLIPPANLCEISYEKFVAHPVECMETIYEQLRLGDFSLCRQAMCMLAKREKDHPVTEHTLEPHERAIIEERINQMSSVHPNVK